MGDNHHRKSCDGEQKCRRRPHLMKGHGAGDSEVNSGKIESKNSKVKSFEWISLLKKQNSMMSGACRVTGCRHDTVRLSPLIIMMVEKSEYGGIDPGVLSRWLRTCFEDHLVRQAKENSLRGLEDLGGAEGLMLALETNIHQGIDSSQVEKRRHFFGSNFVPQDDPDSIWEIALEALKDPSLVFLCFSALISFVLGLFGNGGMEWLEGLAILSAVFVVVTVTAVNDYQKEQQFRALNDAREDVDVIAVRDGSKVHISCRDIVVGDIIHLCAGDLAPADGAIFQKSDIAISEKMLTGETTLKHKGMYKFTGQEMPDETVSVSPAVFAGTMVEEGEGLMVVLAVGVNTYQGKMEEKMKEDEDEKSVLQRKLDDMTNLITKGGAYAGGLAVLVLLARFALAFYDKACCKEAWDNSLHHLEYLRFFVTGVTVFVVAVPEGLPLAVTIALAFSVKKMMADQNLVRHLSACETMGSATTICSDKTGTLTTGRMTVVRVGCGGIVYDHERDDHFRQVPEAFRNVLSLAVVINSSFKSEVEADEEGRVVKSDGNDTECAMLLLSNYMMSAGGAVAGGAKHYADVRKQYPLEHPERLSIPFSSERKMMSTIVPWEAPGGRWGGGGRKVYRLFTKGAADFVLKRCASVMNADGSASPLTAERRAMLEEEIAQFAGAGLRTLGVAYRDFDQQPEVAGAAGGHGADEWQVESKLTLVGLIGMEDHVRPEVPEAIRTCVNAGITVRMITGDDPRTAATIALKCGIITGVTDDCVMTGEQFRNRVCDAQGGLIMDEFDQVWPKLRVLARSSPVDKHTLVHGLQQTRSGPPQVVAVTGDGTNDAPALKRADVGFAMGRTGTQVAQHASDIIIMDDNFASIVQAVKWGRCVYDNICKFLQFQLTVNLTACVLAVIGASILTESPLNVIQLLWVNMIMDSFASLALATEDPRPDLLTRKPYRRDQPLLSRRMLRFMLGHGLWQLIVLTLLIFNVGDVCQAGATADVCVPGTLATNMWGNMRSGRPTEFDEHVFGLNVTCIPAFNPADNATFTVDPNGTSVPLRPASYCRKTAAAEAVPTQHYTIVFTCFVLLQWFNQINARKIHGEVNVWSGILANRYFLGIMAMELLLQFIMVQMPGVNTAMGCVGLSAYEWIFCIAVGATSLPVNFLVCLVKPQWLPTWTVSWQPGKAEDQASWLVRSTSADMVPLLPLSGSTGTKADSHVAL